MNLTNDEFMAIIRRPEFMELSYMTNAGDWYVRINRLGRWFSNSEISQDDVVAWAGRMFAQWDEEDKLYAPACQWLASLCGDFDMPIERGTYRLGEHSGVTRAATWKNTFNGLVKHAQDIGVELTPELLHLYRREEV